MHMKLGEMPESIPDSDAVTVESLAAMEIVPVWEKTSKPGPSHQDWFDWNNDHGAHLRMACAVMTMNKDELAHMAASLDDQIRALSEGLRRSAEFFRDMAKVCEAAGIRLMVGLAVVALNPDDYPEEGNVVPLAGRAVAS